MHGQLLILGVPGTELTSADAALYRKIQPGGFVLFGRNIESPEQTRKLTDDLRDLCDIAPVISIDQEGGRVSRTRVMGTEPPSAQQLREKNEPKHIARHGQLTAYVLRLLGFNMDLCPVLDISYDDAADNALRGRCYGTDAQQVIINAGMFNANLRHYRVQSCGKHFPSCGLADTDPHHAIPHIHKSVQDMFESDLLPYTALMPELDAIMSCHAYFSAIDPETTGLPGSLSHNLITKLLRMQLGYEGVIMTDDLDMGAIVNTYGRGPDVELAIRAGNDMAMICHQIETSEIALDHLKKLPHHILDDALSHIEKMKKKTHKPIPFDAKLWKEIDSDIAELRLNVVGNENEQNTHITSMNSPVEDY